MGGCPLLGYLPRCDYKKHFFILHNLIMWNTFLLKIFVNEDVVHVDFHRFFILSIAEGKLREKAFS